LAVNHHVFVIVAFAVTRVHVQVYVGGVSGSSCVVQLVGSMILLTFIHHTFVLIKLFTR
jgi:hypothetical protein